MEKIIIFAMLSIMTVATAAFGSSWKVDSDHSAANFSISHMTIATVKGSFSKVEGELVFGKNGESPFSLNLTIDASSIDTGVEKRDNHLKSPDFFEVEKYPAITFVSEKVVLLEEGRYQVTGMLTMHGVGKSVAVELEGLAVEVNDPWGNVRKGAQIKGTINRKDFGIVYNAVLDNGSLLIGDDASVSVDLEFIKN